MLASTRTYAYEEQGHLVAEIDSAAGILKQHVWLGDRPIAYFARNINGSTSADVRYLHVDQVNAAVIMTESNKAITWTWNPDPWGNGSGEGINIRFPGQYYDHQDGNMQNWFRDYDPQTGRYLQSDPIGLAGGINTYVYALSNPVTKYDPSGQVPNPAEATCVDPLQPVCWLGVSVDILSQIIATAALSQAMHNDEPCDRAKQCEVQLEIDYEMCDALARATKSGKRPSDAYARCISSAHQRYANCLAGHDPGPLDTWNN